MIQKVLAKQKVLIYNKIRFEKNDPFFSKNIGLKPDNTGGIKNEKVIYNNAGVLCYAAIVLCAHNVDRKLSRHHSRLCQSI